MKARFWVRRHHDLLDIPAAFHEIDGQPVEQIGMARPLALRSKVLTRFYESCAE